MRGHGGVRGGGGARTTGGINVRWWHDLDGDDVISLEPLSDLPYEPFELASQLPTSAGGGTAGASVDAYNYFDGKILSRYLISSGGPLSVMRTHVSVHTRVPTRCRDSSPHVHDPDKWQRQATFAIR